MRGLDFVEVLIVGQHTEMIGLSAEKHIVVTGNDVVRRAVYLEHAVKAEEGDEEAPVTGDGEAANQVNPDNPIGVGKEHRHAHADGLELAEEEEHDHVEQDAVDEDVVVLPKGAQLVEIDEYEDARK